MSQEQQIKIDYSNYIHASKYARWLDDKGRRETWEETVTRYCDFIKDRALLLCPDGNMEEYIERTVFPAIYNKHVMPSMRALMTAGAAAQRDNMAMYNCAYIEIDDPDAFDEMLHALMCGTGMGFSVERQYTSQLPEVPTEIYNNDSIIRVRDSKGGWAEALRDTIRLLYLGNIPKFDLSKLRPSGARLRTFGGRSSGPEPLADLLKFTVATFIKAKGRKLTSLECHDLCCKIAQSVVVGGVRRSALISLSNLTDMRMRNAKQGEWYYINPQRALANNSVCYTEKPDIGIFMDEWKSLYSSKAGERGIFNRTAADKLIPQRRKDLGDFNWGTNPCSEIVLRPMQVCNLSEVVVRDTDTFEMLAEKVRIATFIGTVQSTFTDFRYLRDKWKQNCEEERLLGVSFTGIMDNPAMYGRSMDANLEGQLDTLRNIAIETNKEIAEQLGINQSSSITCVKPSGTVSQLVDSASGIHPRFSSHYIRRVRNDVKDPISTFLIDAGVPYEVDNTNPNAYVFSFPMAAPEGSCTVADVTALQQLELWRIYQMNWCEHKPSITVYVKDDEWLQVAAWVYDNFDIVSGISFLPYSDHVYPQAPYESITKEMYDTLVADFPVLEWSKLPSYELGTDTTTGSQELACVAGQCEI